MYFLLDKVSRWSRPFPEGLIQLAIELDRFVVLKPFGVNHRAIFVSGDCRPCRVAVWLPVRHAVPAVWA